MKLFLLLVVGTSMVYSKPATNDIFSCSFDDSFLEPRYGEKQVVNGHLFKWTDGKIPYYFSGTVTKNDKAVIHKAMKEIEKLTSCFRFQENNIEPSGHHLVIKVGYPSCVDENGMLQFGGGVTPPSGSIVTLTFHRQLADHPRCNNKNFILSGVLHELMHVLGVMHTQKRIDRNETIMVDYDNIENSTTARHQYDICYECELYGVDYDCDSIMHYGTAQKSIGGRPTMYAIDPTCKLTKWGPSSISEGDKELLKIIGRRVCSGRSATQRPNKRCEDKINICDSLQEYCNEPLVNKACARTCNCRGNSRVPDQSLSCSGGKDCEDAWQKTQSDCDCNQD